jgi:peptidoglycan/xylan/chitin deacetylase (PgdA/CDA1 family)
MVRLRCYAVPVAAQQAVVYFDDLREVVATPAVLWSFDDGYSSIYTLAKPILDDYAYRGTCYVNSDTVEAASRMTWAQLKELDGAGWSIGNHTSNHTVLTTVDQATAETVLGDCDDAIAAQGITRTGKYVGYPNNVYPTATVLAAMSASGMLTGRRGGGYMKTPLPPVNNHILSGYSLEGQTVAWAQSILDEVLADQTAAALMCHSLDANGDYGFLTPAAYEEIVAYAASLGLIDITIDEMYRLTLGTVARPDNLGHGEGYYVPTNFAGTWAKGLYTYLS